MNWQHLPFDRVAVAQSDKGRRIKQRDYLPAGAIPVIDQGQETVGGYTDDAALAFDGELPVILFGDHTRTVKLVSQRFAVGADGIKIFRPADGVRPKYLYYWMKSAPVPDRGYGRHYQYLRKLVVPVPAPASQDNIVAEIEKQFSRLDEAVAGLQRVKANLKRYKAAVLKSAVAGRLVPTEADLARREDRSYETGAELLQRILETRRSQWQGKGKYKEPAAPDTADLPELPEGWAWAATEQICDPIASGSTPAPGAMFANSGEVPFIKVYNLTFDGALDFTIKPTFVARATHEGMLARSRSLPGDVLINIVGPPLGKVSIVPGDYPEWNINQAVVTFRPSTAIQGRLLAYWLMASPVHRRLERTAKATAGQFNLQVSTCRRLAIPLPPLPEQHRIVAEVDRLLSIAREQEELVQQNLFRSEALRRSFLAKCFSVSSAPASRRMIP